MDCLVVVWFLETQRQPKQLSRGSFAKDAAKSEAARVIDSAASAFILLTKTTEPDMCKPVPISRVLQELISPWLQHNGLPPRPNQSR